MRRILYLLPLLLLVNGSCYYDYEEGADLSYPDTNSSQYRR